MSHRFLSLPLRRSLDGVTWASVSVQWIPTEEQKRARRLEAEQLSLFNLPEPEQRPLLHPLGGRRYPVERFWFRVGRASKRGWPGPFAQAANTDDFKSSGVAASGSVAVT